MKAFMIIHGRPPRSGETSTKRAPKELQKPAKKCNPPQLPPEIIHEIIHILFERYFNTTSRDSLVWRKYLYMAAKLHFVNNVFSEGARIVVTRHCKAIEDTSKYGGWKVDPGDSLELSLCKFRYNHMVFRNLDLNLHWTLFHEVRLFLDAVKGGAKLKNIILDGKDTKTRKSLLSHTPKLNSPTAHSTAKSGATSAWKDHIAKRNGRVRGT